MRIEDVNPILKNKKPATTALKAPAVKAPAVKAPKVANNPDVASLKSRVASARKQVGEVLAQAKKLGAAKVAAQSRELSAKLVAMEAELNTIYKA